MHLRTSKDLDREQKPNEQANDVIEIRLVPLPEEQRAGYYEAIRWITLMILEEVNIENEIRSDDRLEAAYHLGSNPDHSNPSLIPAE